MSIYIEEEEKNILEKICEIKTYQNKEKQEAQGCLKYKKYFDCNAWDIRKNLICY